MVYEYTGKGHPGDYVCGQLVLFRGAKGHSYTWRSDKWVHVVVCYWMRQRIKGASFTYLVAKGRNLIKSYRKYILGCFRGQISSS